MPPLTENQTSVLLAVRDETKTVGALGLLRDSGGYELGSDTVRKIVDRLEKRGLVKTSGQGTAREVVLEEAGDLELAANGHQRPLPSPTNTRPYHVLERVDIHDDDIAWIINEIRRSDVGRDDVDRAAAVLSQLYGRRVFVQHDDIVGRNSEHAQRQAAELLDGLYHDRDVQTSVVVVPERMWGEEPLTIGNTRRIKIGA